MPKEALRWKRVGSSLPSSATLFHISAVGAPWRECLIKMCLSGPLLSSRGNSECGREGRIPRNPTESLLWTGKDINYKRIYRIVKNQGRILICLSTLHLSKAYKENLFETLHLRRVTC